MGDSIYQEKINLTVKETDVIVPPGGSVTISAVMTNLGSDDDYFELSIKGVPAGWVSMETSVVHLSPGELHELALTFQPAEQPQLRAGVFPFTILVTSQGFPDEKAEVSGTLTVATYQTEGRIGVLLLSTQFTAAPGSPVGIPILLINRGLEAEVFRMRVEGIPKSWVSSSAALTRLEPGQEAEIELSILPLRSPHSTAGRHPFTILFASQEHPGDEAQVDCTLTVGAFSEFRSQLFPSQLNFWQSSHLAIENLGNYPETYQAVFQSQGDALRFERVERQQVRSANGETQERVSYTEIREPQVMQISPGETGAIEFRARPVPYPLVGGDVAYAFTAQVQSTEDLSQTLQGDVTGKALFPVWLFPTLAVILVSTLCFFTFLLGRRQDQTASATQTAQALNNLIYAATQTASFNQTQAAIMGQEDTDGDGLVNSREVELGTDPTRADTDGDELLDGEEVDPRGTDPLRPDTDEDGLSDGEEVIRRSTDPLNPDTDGDNLVDGVEVQRNSDPLKPDTDGDGLQDGSEIELGTDPRNPDSDSDSLPDGQETPPCPSPLDPDSDEDGIIDGQDLDRCDRNNPSLTATAGVTPPGPTSSPAQPSATPPQAPTNTPPASPQPLHGTFAIESNRDGNPEIYLVNLEDQSVTRLTDHPGADTQPAWSPDGSKIAFASNRSGNFEIYTMNADGTALTNLTNHPADDQYPAWSPDGSQIAFATNRDGNSEIYRMDADGTDPLNLTRNPAEDLQPEWFNQDWVVVLATDWIAFTSNRDGNQEVYLMLPDGSDPVNLSNHPANDSLPAANGDGSQIAFVSNRDGNPDIYLTDVEGASQVNLSNHPGEDTHPAFSPDGPWLAFTTNRDGNREIYAVNTETYELLNPSRSPGEDLYSDWIVR